MKTFKIIGLAIMATLTGTSFSACTSETEELLGLDTEIRLTSLITSPSRGTDLNQQATQIVTGQQVGVTITGAKSAHDNIAWTAGDNGALTNTGEALFYGSSSATITAYHPYNSAWKGINSNVPFGVFTDQSNEGYLKSDLLWATASSRKKAEAVELTFSHKLAKINVTLTKPTDSDINLSGANIYINGVKLGTYFNPSTGEVTHLEDTYKYLIKAGTTTVEKPTSTAIIVPQTVASGTKFIKVELNGNNYNYTLAAEKTFESGKSYSYTLNLTKGLEVNLVSENINTWTEDDSPINETIENEEVKFRNVTTAGTLSSLINETDKYSITALKVNGDLNGTDIRVLREMAGRDHQNATTNGKLIYLDLSEANIVSGGEAYFREYYTTQTNTMGEIMFAGCNLQNIILPESVTTLDKGFITENPITTITVPAKVSQITEALTNLPMLYDIFVDKNNPYFITEDGCLFNKDKTELISFPAAKYVQTYSVPNSVTKIRTYAFNRTNIGEIIIPINTTTIEPYTFSGSYCKSITLPNSITTIKEYAFYNCSNLATITLPNNISTIGEYAFSRCYDLTSITLPKSTTTIGKSAFEICSHLKEIHCLSTTPPTAGVGCFYSVPKDAILYVPKGSKADYETAEIWKDFETIIEE